MNPDRVIQGKGGGYFVRSRTHAGAYYFVDNDDEGNLACTCPATVAHCRHMRAAAEFWAEQDREARERRPKMAPAPGSVFVD